MSFSFWRTPGCGSKDTDPLLEAAIPPSPEYDHLKLDDDNSDAGSDSDDEDQDIKDARAERLREAGGWLGYLRDFTIFIPYVIPRGDLKVQFCLFVCILSLILDRVMHLVIPYTLGIIADKVASGS